MLVLAQTASVEGLVSLVIGLVGYLRLGLRASASSVGATERGREKLVLGG